MSARTLTRSRLNDCRIRVDHDIKRPLFHEYARTRDCTHRVQVECAMNVSRTCFFGAWRTAQHNMLHALSSIDDVSSARKTSDSVAAVFPPHALSETATDSLRVPKVVNRRRRTGPRAELPTMTTQRGCQASAFPLSLDIVHEKGLRDTRFS